MPRSDYERLITERKYIAKETNYCIVAPGDENYYLTIAKFYDKRTTLWEYKHYPILFGVYVDIFILDYYCGNERNFHEAIHRHQKLWNRYQNSILEYSWDYLKFLIKGRHLRTLMKYPLLCLKNHLTDKNKNLQEYLCFIEEFKNKNIGSPDFCAWLQQDIIYESNWFDDYIVMPFEDIEVRVPVGYHDYLTNRYGDYMTPPPVSEQVPSEAHAQYYLNMIEGLTMEEVRNRIRQGEHLIL